MRTEITKEEIDTRLRQKRAADLTEQLNGIISNFDISGAAAKAIEGMNLTPNCYIHKGNFAGGYIEYTTKERKMVKVCMPCIYKIIDNYLGV